MDNQANPRPGTFNVQTAPQVVTIDVTPTLLAALAGIQETLGLILAEVQGSGQLFREVQSSQLRMDAMTEQFMQRYSAGMAPGGHQEAQEALSGQAMAEYASGVPQALTGPNNASELSSKDVADQTPSPDAIYEGMTPAQVYKAIEANWVMNDSGNPVYRQEDGTFRDLTPMEANAVRAQLAKSRKRR